LAQIEPHMKKIIYLISLALLITIAACKKDKCEGVVCENGGTCDDGNCKCLAGFTGTYCETHTNGCDTIVCAYNIACLDGECKCPAHYSGADCSILEQPSRMYITGVTVNNFHPSYRDGTLWDTDEDGSPPDIYAVVRRNGVIIFHGYNDYPTYAYKENANPTTPQPFVFHEDSIPITDITNPEYRIELWDHDASPNPDDSMYGFNFTPWTGLNGFPGSFTYHDTTYYNDEFEFRVNFSRNYEW
jgi:hypothetical protein